MQQLVIGKNANAIGRRCDKKMTHNGRLRCTVPKCRRRATVIAKFVYRDYKPDVNWTKVFCCDKSEHQGSKPILETNAQGYIANSVQCGTWGIVHRIARYEDRDDPGAYTTD